MPHPTVPKKTIAVDIDDVLSYLVPQFIKYSNERWGTNLTIDDYDEHWGKLWKIDEEELKKRTAELHTGDMAASLQHNPDARSALDKLKAHFNLVLVTSRRRVISRETDERINKYFPGYFSEIHFAGIWDTDDHTDKKYSRTKDEVLKKIGAHYFIDDQPKHCIAAAEAGIKALLFGDYAWNKTTKLRPNMVRVKNWQEVLEYFDAQN